MGAAIRTLLVAALLPIVLVIGVYWGGHPEHLPGFMHRHLVDDGQAQQYQEAVDIIQDDYFRKINRNDLLNTSIGAAVTSLKDQFSNYFDPKQYKQFNDSTNAQFEGVGMNVEAVKQGLHVLRVFDNSPAKDSGLRAGDIITKVNGKSIAGKTSEQATAGIRGTAGTSVSLTWTHRGEPVTKDVKRARVDVPVVESKLETAPDGEKVGWVALSQFSAGAHAEVAQAVKKLLKQGAKGFVLDLRDNGGGLLQEGVLVASVFIEDGRIVSTKGRSRPEQVFNAQGKSVFPTGPLAVLVNGNTASASEIVTGALQDRKRALVVGVKTFGKGVFQEVRPLSNGGALDITVGEYFTPSGRNLGGGGVKRGAGVTPTVKVQDNPKTKPDEALDKAVLEVSHGAKPTS